MAITTRHRILANILQRVSAPLKKADLLTVADYLIGHLLPYGQVSTASLARNLVATIQTTGGEGGEYPKAGWVPHVPAHVHNFADLEQRGSEGGTGTPMSCEQSHYAGSLRAGGYAEQAAGTKQTCSDGAQQGRSTGLTGP